MKRRLLCMIFMVAATAAAALDKPNNFTDGNTASAVEVNENFDALYGALPALHDATGKFVGILMERPIQNYVTNMGFVLTYVVYVPSEKKYTKIIDGNVSENTISAYYDNPGCAGDVYADSATCANYTTPGVLWSLGIPHVYNGDGTSVGFASSFGAPVDLSVGYRVTSSGCDPSYSSMVACKLTVSQSRPEPFGAQFTPPYTIK